jgi:hypothetical protein
MKWQTFLLRDLSIQNQKLYYLHQVSQVFCFWVVDWLFEHKTLLLLSLIIGPFTQNYGYYEMLEHAIQF